MTGRESGRESDPTSKESAVQLKSDPLWDERTVQRRSITLPDENVVQQKNGTSRNSGAEKWRTVQQENYTGRRKRSRRRGWRKRSGGTNEKKKQRWEREVHRREKSGQKCDEAEEEAEFPIVLSE